MRDPAAVAQMQLLPLTGTPEDVKAAQYVLGRAPGYAHRVTGEPPAPTGGEELFSALPPGVGRDAKHVYGVALDAKVVGCVELIRRWPDAETALVGLLVLDEEHAGQGLGRAAYEATENVVRQWPEIRRLRAAVVATNDVVLPFWRAMGLVETGEVKPYQRGHFTSRAIILAKSL